MLLVSKQWASPLTDVVAGVGGSLSLLPCYQLKAHSTKQMCTLFAEWLSWRKVTTWRQTTNAYFNVRQAVAQVNKAHPQIWHLNAVYTFLHTTGSAENSKLASNNNCNAPVSRQGVLKKSPLRPASSSPISSADYDVYIDNLSITFTLTQ